MRCDATGPWFTCSSDPRITGTGRLLRRFGLDELPQLFNVLRGDMTLVGPRPACLEWARRYPPEHQWLFRHRPGLTGPCQLQARSLEASLDHRPDAEEFYLKVLVPRFAVKNAEFLAHPTVLTVLGYIPRTVWYILSAAWDRSDRSSSGQDRLPARSTGGGRF
jgi:lipopolysaccharide/colanic/teichoic acid biosynthesis glycosyltransferase